MIGSTSFGMNGECTQPECTQPLMRAAIHHQPDGGVKAIPERVGGVFDRFGP
jgi:hypothetical protein